MAKRAKTPDMIKGESLTIRLRPKIKYGLELLSRKQHRSISDVIETIATNAFSEVFVRRKYVQGSMEVKDFDEIWAPTEAERLFLLATNYPDLMNYEDELRWKLINSIELLWRSLPADRKKLAVDVDDDLRDVWVPRGDVPSNWRMPEDPEYRHENGAIHLAFLDLDALELAWTEIKRAANDEITKEELRKVIADLLKKEPTFTPSASGS